MKFKLVAAGLIAGISIGGRAAEAPASPVVAQVGPLTITLEDFDGYWQSLAEPRREAYLKEKGKRGFLDNLVRQKLLVAEALRLGLDREPERRIELEMQRERLLTSALVHTELDRRLLPEKDVRAYYEAHSADFKEPEMVHARHILVTPRKDTKIDNAQQDDAMDETAAKAKIARIQALLAQGEDFGRLAIEWSEDITASKGGNLGLFARGRMVQSFEDAVFALEPGARSGVIESTYGYHLIESLGRTPARVPPFEEVRERIESLLRRERRDDFTPQVDLFVEELRARYDIKLHADLLEASDGE